MRTCEKIMLVFEQGAKSPTFNTTHLRVLAVGKTLEVLTQREYSFTLKVEETPRLTLAYFSLWILGEYGNTSDDWNISAISETLARCLLVNDDNMIQGYILTALTKIALNSESDGIPKYIIMIIRNQIINQPLLHRQSQPSTTSRVDIQQRAQEFLMVAELMS
ncbi:hypothetical protein BGZ76_010523 [Entomortierella beljakovae]|nr:hypothetical protein BGZ76_010523 [Entomortierella beljakovae]